MADLIGTYEYDWMRAIPGGFGTAAITNQGILWNLVHALTGDLQVRDGGSRPAGAWTVDGSSDGAAAGMDGSNRWWNAGVFSAALLPWGASNFGWIVLKSPAALAPQTWMLVATTTTNPDAKVYLSFTAFAGGGVSALPTSSTSFTPSNLGADWTMCSTALNHKTSLSLASDGAWFWGANSAGATFKLAMSCNKLLDPPAGDLFPVCVWRCNHTDQMQVGYHNAFPASSGSSPYGPGHSAWSAVFMEQDSGAGTYGYTYSPWATRSRDNSTTVWMRPIFPTVRYPGNLDGLAAGDISTTVARGFFTLDQIRQQYPEWQVWLVAVSAGANCYGVKGRVRDLHTAFGLAELICEPSGTDPITRVVWGHSSGAVWVPGNQVMTF